MTKEQRQYSGVKTVFPTLPDSVGITGHPCAKNSELRYRPYILHKNNLRDFPGGAVVKNPLAKAGDTGSSPGLGRSHTPRSN